ncbi:PREDICTED: protein phosphatase Slingshot homolog 1 [Hipposideros armiger]|uniref:Protein phosphatase Slingshot homolog 1 n=1 Tax=Hipposideros armiger TaxID=186990 RepID=A0A8B7RU24_HIPAR|nr:PREDICTED: protein phosphatase Slingshot homolog 1 [Hipposideros armiger]
MALVTLQRSPTPSAASSSASNSELEAGSDEDRKLNLSLSESFFMVKGAALFLQQGNSPQGQRSLQHPHKHAGDLPQHLQVMINLLRCEDRIKLAVRLESAWAERVRYMVVVDSSGRQDTEESILLGVDFSSKESKSCTIGMVLRLWSDTKIHLDGDGGFSVSTAGRMHVFKPVSVQAMWALFVDKPTEGERTERLIKAKLRSIMMSQDLENVTSKEIRNELEKQMNCNLKEFKEFIDNEMLLILGQMDKPSLIFDHLYLGSEWNASNLEELQGSGVDYILNVTREIDNFFPGLFAYHNIRVYDEETTDLLAHWNEAYHFINKAKRNHSKCLVHCKMGVSRSASTVIAYAMKEFGWPLEKAYNYVRQKRSIARPNAGFMRQLSEYEGILDASKQRHNKLWRQQTESGLQQPVDDPAGPGDFLPETLDGAPPEAPLPCLEDATQPGFPGSRAPGGPVIPCCFRRLSDPLLHSSSDETGSLVQLEDLEKDALLEEAAQPARPPQEGPGLCEKEVKKKRESGSLKTRSGPLPQVEEMEREEVPGAGRWGKPPTQLDKNLLNRENLNNNNSKRSCPDDFEVSMGPACGDRGPHHFHPALQSSPLTATSAALPAGQFSSPATCGLISESDSAGRLGIGQTSIIQLQKAGLVRKHTKELERLKGTPADLASPFRDGATSRLEASIPEENQDLAPGPEPGTPALPGHAAGDEKSEAGPPPSEGASLKSATPFLCRLDHTSHFSKDFLKTICYTPTSSSMSSNLTRSSSSDSIHSVRGKPGLVKQRTQEIETRLRLAGLTVSSPLKRSHSLAKLGSLNFSTEDLTSEADVSTIADSQDAKLSEASFLHEPQATPRNSAATSMPSGKSAPENLKSPSWVSKS